MAQELRVVYRDSDKSIIGFLGADLDHEDHEDRSLEGIKVASHVLEFADEDIVYPEMVSIDSNGNATKV